MTLHTMPSPCHVTFRWSVSLRKGNANNVAHPDGANLCNEVLLVLLAMNWLVVIIPILNECHKATRQSNHKLFVRYFVYLIGFASGPRSNENASPSNTISVRSRSFELFNFKSSLPFLNVALSSASSLGNRKTFPMPLIHPERANGPP